MIRTKTFVTGAVALLTALVAFAGCSSVGADGASCTNALKDGDEIGVDCGGSCATLCTGAGCTANEECASAKCESGACAAKDGKPCGVGTPVAQCDNGQPCELDQDCKSLTCDGATCALTPDSPPGPADLKKNNGETDVDCGGPNAPKCADGKTCDGDGDCENGYCPADTKVCATARYDDGVKNGTETDVDCGGTGPGMLKCAEPKSCLVDGDCNGACNFEKKCSDVPSCKPKLGGYTCGPGEVHQGGAGHESCCRTLPVTGFTDPKYPGKKVYLDKYEITAGRFRVFMEDIAARSAGKPDVKSWVAANTPTIWDNGWNKFLPSDGELESIVVPHNPSNGTEAQPWNRNVGANNQFNSQLFVYVHGHNCINTAGSYGFPTYWLPDAMMVAKGGKARANPSDGTNVIPAKDALDVKSMTCVTNALLVAFCHWDGGQLATDEVLDFVTNTPASLGNKAGCGSRCAPLASVNATSDSGTQNFAVYNFPYYDNQTPASPASHEGTGRIAAPGRVQADIVRFNAADEPWMDLHGNLEEAVLDMNGATFSGSFGLKYRGIGYNSSRANAGGGGGNLTKITYPEYKAAYTGGRCMRFK